MISFLQTQIVSMYCVRSHFIDKDLAHILRCDVHIIKSYTLKKLICKGPEHCKKKAIKFTSAKKYIREGIDKCIRPWSNKKIIMRYY